MNSKIQSHDGFWLRVRHGNLLKIGKHQGPKTIAYSEFRDSDMVVNVTKHQHGTCHQIHPYSATDLLITHCGVQLLVSVHRTAKFVMLNDALEKELGVKAWAGREWHKWEPMHCGSVSTTVVTNSDNMLLVVIIEASAAADARRARRQLLDATLAHYDVTPRLEHPLQSPVHRTLSSSSSIAPLRFALPCGTYLDLSFQTNIEVLVCLGDMAYNDFCKQYPCMPGNGLDGRVPTEVMLCNADINFARLRDITCKPSSWRQLLCEHARLDLYAVLAPREHDFEPLWFNENDAVERAIEKLLFKGLPTHVPCVRMTQWRKLTSDFNETVWCATCPERTIHIAIDVCY